MKISNQAIKVTPIVWIFLAIISVLVLMIVLIGLILRARCSKSSRHKAKFVRATEQQSTLLKENGLPNTRGNNPDLIPDPGDINMQFLLEDVLHPDISVSFAVSFSVLNNKYLCCVMCWKNVLFHLCFSGSLVLCFSVTAKGIYLRTKPSQLGSYLS